MELHQSLEDTIALITSTGWIGTERKKVPSKDLIFGPALNGPLGLGVRQRGSRKREPHLDSSCGFSERMDPKLPYPLTHKHVNSKARDLDNKELLGDRFAEGRSFVQRVITDRDIMNILGC